MDDAEGSRLVRESFLQGNDPTGGIFVYCLVWDFICVVKVGYLRGGLLRIYQPFRFYVVEYLI